jgi:RNA polymerase sigma factor (sigma-70 family)
MRSASDNGGMIQRAAAGDQRAWEQLVQLHRGRLRLIAAGHRLKPTEADDAIQMTWLSLVRAIGQIRSPERLTAWLATTMRRNCLRVLASRRTERLTELVDIGIADPSTGVEDLVLLAERKAMLWGAIERLPHKQARLVRALFTDHMPSYHDVAAALSMPVGAIGPTRQRALHQIAKLLTEAGTPAHDLKLSA